VFSRVRTVKKCVDGRGSALSALNPLGSLQRSPRPLAGLRGGGSENEGGDENKGGMEGERRDGKDIGKGKDGKGGKGEGRRDGGEGDQCGPLSFSF